MNGGAATAEGIKDDIAFVRGGIDDSIEKGERFLRGVAKSFVAADWFDVMPDITDRNSFLLV